MTLKEIFADPIMIDIIIKATVVGFLVSLCASLLGVSLVLKRYSMIGDGLSHFGFLAVAVATTTGIFGNFSLEVEMAVVILVAIVILRIGNRSKTTGDAAIAIFSTAGIALGSIVYNITGNNTMDVCTSLFGSSNIFTISDSDLLISVIAGLIILTVFVLFYTRIFAVTFDSDFASATGTNSTAMNTIIAVLAAVVIVLGMKMMGAIMVSGLIIFPALSSMRLCKSFKSVVLLSGIFSVAGFLIGFYIACRMSFQTGPTVVTVDVLIFVICLAISAITKRKPKLKNA